MTIQLTEARIVAMLEALVQVVGNVSIIKKEMLARYSPQHYAPQSPAAFAAMQSPHIYPEWSARMQASFSLQSLVDHCAALTYAIKASLPFSSGTIARGILEASQKAAWVLDPGITEKDRKGRCIGAIIQDLKSVDRLAKSAGSEDTTFQDLILEIQEQWGQPYEEQKGDILGTKTYYHLFAGMFHQNPSIMQMTSLKRSISPSTVSYRPSMTLNQKALLVRPAIHCFGIVAWRYFRHCGFNFSDLSPVFISAGKVSGLPERFWEYGANDATS